MKYDHSQDENDVTPAAASTTMHEISYTGSGSNETITYYNETMITNETHHNHFRFLEDNDDGNFDYVYEGCHEVYHPRVILLVVMSIAFMIFTCCMLMEQADAIDSNTSKIARMKIAMGQNQDGEFDRKTEQCNEMFGIGPLTYNYMGNVARMFRWCDRGGSHVALHWFLPTPVRFPEGKLDAVLGFEFKDQWFGKIYEESMDEEEEREEGYHSGISVGSISTKHSLELDRAELGANVDLNFDGGAEKRIRGRSLLPSPSPSSSVIGSTTTTTSSTGRMTHQRQPKELVLEMNKVVEMKRVSSTRSSSTISKRSGGSAGAGTGGKVNDEKEGTSPSDTKIV